MARFLQGWAIASAIMLTVVTASGFFAPATVSRDVHVLAGYLATVAALFSHTISMFYFIGTGSALKGAAKDHAARGDRSLVPLWEQTKAFKGSLFPLLMLAMGGIMGASIVGAGSLTGALPVQMHLTLELAAVALNLYALVRTAGLIEQNIALVSAAERILERADSGAS